MNRYVLSLFLPIAAATPVFAAINLDFGDATTDNHFVATAASVDYGLVGTDELDNDIYARITRLNTYSLINSGATAGDAQINVSSNTIELKLTLYGDASYSTLYDPGESYSWTSTFADIEGTDGTNKSVYESITVHTAGTYEIASDTVLQISADGTSTTFSGQGTTLYANPAGDAEELTVLQGQVAVAYTVTDTASIEFAYSAFNSTRNLFIDVGNLKFNSETVTETYVVGTVPEPATSGLLLGASGILMVLLRRKRG
jgi:hypothetical protein